MSSSDEEEGPRVPTIINTAITITPSTTANGTNKEEHVHNMLDTIRRERAGDRIVTQLDLCEKNSKLDKFPVALLGWSNVQIETYLGKGSFSEVHSVRIVITNNEGDNENDANNHHHHQQDHEEQEPYLQQSYALKCVRPDIVKDGSPDTFYTAAEDLAIEGDILSRLSHENIIRIYGTYQQQKDAYLDCTNKGYFLILENLEEILTDRLHRLRDAHHKRRIRLMNQSMSQSGMLELVKNICLGVAKGLEYMHKSGVIMRDLKPGEFFFQMMQYT